MNEITTVFRNASLTEEPIHVWFELSYAEYLTIPRSVLQSMPTDWQQRFVACLEELDAAVDWYPDRGKYKVRLHDIDCVWDEEEGEFVNQWGIELDDPLMDYDRGRRRIPTRVRGMP